MSPQLTLQAPVALPPPELTDYLEKLWSQDLESASGASTFTLLVWQPAWVEQHLVRTGRLDGPVTGVVRTELLEAAREAVLTSDLPLSISPSRPSSPGPWVSRAVTMPSKICAASTLTRRSAPSSPVG